MTRAGRNLGKQFIAERKVRDEAERFYVEASAVDNVTRQRAQFEARTFNRFQAGEIKRREMDVSVSSENNVEQRRQKLAMLLKSEENQYAIEAEACVETPISRRERLKEQLTTLRARRAQEHDEFVKEKNEQGWRDQCDPLRHQISEALNQQVIAERDKQIIEHEQKKLEADQEELKYHAQIMRDTQEWKESLEREREIRRQKLLQNKTTWIGQMDEHNQIAQKKREKENLWRALSLEQQLKELSRPQERQQRRKLPSRHLGDSSSTP